MNSLQEWLDGQVAEPDQGEVDEALEAVEKLLAEKSLRDFTHQMWPLVEPVTPLVWGWSDDAVCEHLEALDAGQIENLLINVSPGTGKSTKVTVAWPVRSWALDPTTRWLFGSHGMDLATRDSIRRRFVMESGWFRRRWADAFSFLTDQNVKTHFSNDHQGTMEAVSVGGGVTGKRANRIVIDDPINVQQLKNFSTAALDEAAWWFSQVLPSRKNAGCKMCVVMQRVGMKDPSGLLIERGNFVHLRIPMESDGKPCRTVLGWRPDGAPWTWEDPRKEPGVCMNPALFPPAFLADKRIEIGTDGYEGQYQQNPVTPGGNMVKTEWLQQTWRRGIDNSFILGEKIWKDKDVARIIIVDLATSTKKTADYSSIGCYGLTPKIEKWRNLLLLEMDRRRLEGPDILPAIEAMKKRWDAGVIWIETTGFQLSIFQFAQRQGLPVKELKRSKGGKEDRMMSATPLLEAGHFWMPIDGPWIAPFRHEVLVFPKGEHDDQADNLADACRICMDMPQGKVSFF